MLPELLQEKILELQYCLPEDQGKKDALSHGIAMPPMLPSMQGAVANTPELRAYYEFLLMQELKAKPHLGEQNINRIDT